MRTAAESGAATEALLRISRMWRHYEGDIERATHEITETSASALGIERVSVWIYDRSRRVITCRDLYEATPNRHSSGCELSAELFPSYFEAMELEVIAAEDAITDLRTHEFAETYLKPHGAAPRDDLCGNCGAWGRSVD